MPIKAIFFDAAGTLIQVREPVGRVYAAAARRHGIEADEETMGRAFRSAWKSLPHPQNGGAPAADDERSWWRELVRRCFARAAKAEPPERQLAAAFDELYEHYSAPNAWSVFDDVLPALARLRDRYRLLVLSNFDRRLRAILSGHGLAGFFSSMIISSEVGASKPHRLIFEAARAAAGCSAEECLHAGDDPVCDVLGATAAGFRFFHVRRPEAGIDRLAKELG